MQRLNVDQSPLPFACDVKRIYHMFDSDEDKKMSKVRISQPGSGLDKRQCTLQICFSPVGQQPQLAIIFRGKGKRISDDEKAAWHEDVDVYFQENGWADTAFSVEWAKKTLAPFVADHGHFALFCDNLSAQVSEEFKKAILQLHGVCWYGLWQPVDAGYGSLLEVFIQQAHRRWLDSDEYAD